MRVSVENVESIHAHSAWATLEWPGASERPVDSADAAVPCPPPVATREPFGNWLRGERTGRSWSQQDLAARIGVSAPHLSKVEAGERNLPDGAFERLGEALGRSPDWLRLRAGIVPTSLLERIQADPDRLLSALGA
jgi:plasmid maintenance system antidote protein VapI